MARWLVAFAVAAVVSVTLHGWAQGPGSSTERGALVWTAERGGQAYLRQPFVLSEAPASARLRVLSRGPYTAYVNGAQVSQGRGGDQPVETWVTSRLTRGRNVLAIACDRSARYGAAFDLMVRFASGRTVWVRSDASVRASGRKTDRWTETGVDDRAWQRARVLGTVALGAAQTGAAPPAAPTTAARPAPAAPPASADPTRLVRVWDIRAAGRTGQPPYAGAREVGQRMLMTCEVPAPASMPVVAAAGFTLLQTDSDHLSTEETAPGVWDFSRADDGLRRSREAGFDWCYFPHYAFPPKWYADSVPFTRIRCLEHDKTVPAYSPWDPRFPRAVGRGYEQLAARYGSTATALYLGIHGDYGETGMLMGARTAVPGQREDWQARFGDLHNHLGWWCADPLARQAFRTAMLRKYGALEVVNAAWKTQFATEDAIVYPARPDSGARRWWLDFVEWYRGEAASMTDAVCRVARRGFPNALLILPVGFGDENPRGGQDNSLIPRVAARNRVEVRSTHGGFRPFPSNSASMLNRIASACKHYGAPLWVEPPGTISKEAQVSRIFEAVSMGAKGFYDWSANVLQNREVYYRYGRFLRVEKPITDVAMLYASTSHMLRPDLGYLPTFERGCTAMRDVMAYDIVDERMVADGALDRYRVLVMWEGAVLEQATLARIREWVRAGGVLAAYDFGKIETVEGDGAWFADLFGYAGRLRPAAASYRYVGAGAVPLRSRIRVGEPEAAGFLNGDWYESEPEGQGQRARWTGASADLLFPAPATGASLAISAAVPPEAAGRKREVFVNGVRLGSLNAESPAPQVFEVPASAFANRETAVVSIRSDTWRPSEVLKDNADGRALGVRVMWVELDAGDVGTRQATPAPPPPGRFEVVVDARRLRSEWARSYGKGWTVYYPARRAQLHGYYEVVRYLAYHLSELDPDKRDAIAIDDAWDGVFGTLFADKVLYYNPRPEPAKRTLKLDPAQLAGRRDLSAPGQTSYEVEIEPQGIAGVYFKEAPQELLLQCEKFAGLGSLKPVEGQDFSPGAGPTHVLIPTGGQISTRFEVQVAGRYRVVYRAVRRGRKAEAEVSVNGRRIGTRGADPVGPSRPETHAAGAIYLGKGVHSLTLRPRPGEDVRADFVVLTNDPTIAGYRFAVR